MNILGINYYYHDTSAAIVSNGKLLAVIEEERFSRDKHTTAFPATAIARSLEVAGMAFSDIDQIAVSIKPGLNWPAKTWYWMSHVGHSMPFLKHEVWGAYNRQAGLFSWYRAQARSGRKSPPIHFVPHHLAHAAGTFLVSPFEDAAILSLDGSGEWATSFLGGGAGTQVECYQQSYFPHSLGSYYEAATEFCGFRPNYDEGKTMGLAPFGDSAAYHQTVADMIRVDSTGTITADLSYFDYQFWGRQRCSEKFYQTFGKPRHKDESFSENHQNVAAAFQRVLEERALELCRVLRSRTKARNLVIAGGVALNSVMNGRLIREGDFDEIYVMPAAGDNGTSIGAAYYLHHVVLGAKQRVVHDNPYLGNEYSDDAIEKLLRECKLPIQRFDDIADEAARLLAEGNILGWFQGRMEIGPRALGNRSILADPTLPHMKDKINAEVKHREAYRPFAPSVPVEFKDRYFDAKGDSPFMLKVCDVLPDMRQRLPAITHVDGSARLQTVDRHINPLYHRLLQKFGERRGTPVLLNTSFNVQGEPIVESPSDAIRCFFSTGLDYLVLGSYLVRKGQQ